MLITTLKGIVASGWKSDNDFKMGYLQILEHEMQKYLHGTNLKGLPHINSKIHVWKEDYESLVSMLSRSGRGWNDSTKMIEANDEVFADYMKVDSNARLMRHKCWPYYEDWIEIFGKDRAIGEHAEDMSGIFTKEFTLTGAHTELSPEDVHNLYEDLDENFKETMCENTPQQSESAKKSKSGCKRKSSDFIDPLCEVMSSFAKNTTARLGEIAKRIGYEYGISLVRKEVYSTVGTIEGLTMQEKLLVMKLLVKNTENLELFFSLPTDAKAEFARMKLTGSL